MLRDRVSASTIDACYDRISPAVEDAMIATLDVTAERTEPSVMTSSARDAGLPGV